MPSSVAQCTLAAQCSPQKRPDNVLMLLKKVAVHRLSTNDCYCLIFLEEAVIIVDATITRKCRSGNLILLTNYKMNVGLIVKLTASLKTNP